MEPLQLPEGDVVATHPATLTGRILAVLMLMLPGGALIWAATQAQGTRADARIPLIAAGVTLVILGILALVQQNRSQVVVRADGLERWGLRGRLWALRWADMIELRYRAVKMRLYHVIPVGTTIYITLTDPHGKKHRVPSNMKAMDILAERIADQQTAVRFSEARAIIDRGEEVRFGKALIVDREKLSARKLFGGYKSCPITDIEKVAVENGFLRIRQRGKLLGFGGGNIGSIPNVFLFLRLLDSLIGRASAIPQDRQFAAQRSVG